MNYDITSGTRAGNLARQAFGWGLRGGVWAAFTLYVFIMAVVSVVIPPMMVLAIAPFIPVIMWLAPDLPAVPAKLTRRLIYAGAFLMPLWPVYLHIKLGPAPILTPTRLMFYSVVFIWLYEMSCVPRRRKQFLAAAKRLWPLFLIILLLFAQKFLSIPLAVGKAIAAKEFFRQVMIWLLPFLAVITYIHRREQFDRMIGLIIAASAVIALIAIGEFATHKHLAEILSPLIGQAEWLTQVLEAKVRDGVFRSQATHTHPLSMGEHLAMVIPFAMYKTWKGGEGGRRWLYGGLLLILIAAALMSNSRGALIGGMMAFAVTFFLMLAVWLRRPGALIFRPLAGLMIVGAMIATPVAGAAAYKLASGDSGSLAAKSSQARVDQAKAAWPKILTRPVTGYGNGRAARVLGFYERSLTIDNYYLNLALELGFPGPLLFFGSFAVLALYSYRWGTQLYEDPYAGLYCAVAGCAIAFAVTRSILSITTNIELMMLIMALFIGTCARTRYLAREKAKAPPPPAEPVFAEQSVDAGEFMIHQRKVLAGKSLWRPLQG